MIEWKANHSVHTMTVAEAIEVLSKLPQDLPILLGGEGKVEAFTADDVVIWEGAVVIDSRP